ncbi:hypothetical protein RJZ90_002328 [Blastomyces dermatitidis]
MPPTGDVLCCPQIVYRMSENLMLRRSQYLGNKMQCDWSKLSCNRLTLRLQQYFYLVRFLAGTIHKPGMASSCKYALFTTMPPRLPAMDMFPKSVWVNRRRPVASPYRQNSRGRLYAAPNDGKRPISTWPPSTPSFWAFPTSL